MTTVERYFLAIIRGFGYAFVITSCVVLLSNITGCNTMAGMGRDIQAAAQGVQEHLATQYVEEK